MRTTTRHIMYWSIGIFIAIVFYLLSAAPVHAQTLQVIFEDTPLFNQANLKPGDSVSRYVEVGNYGTTSEDVYVRVENTSSTGLADGVRLTVTGGATTYFTGTFSAFFDAETVSLGSLAAGATTTYNFIASFPSSAGNEYQERSMGFDLVVGFEGGQSESDGNNGGGGRGGGSSSFRIFNESVDDVDDDAGTATLSWRTNRDGTTRLVCGSEDDGPFVLDPDAPNFGYTFSTAEDTTMTEDHEVTRTGLASGTYLCRPVSREALDDEFTVGDELSFTIGERVAPFVPDSPFGPGTGGSFPIGQIAGTGTVADLPPGVTTSTSTISSGNEFTSDGPQGQVASAFTGADDFFGLFTGACDCAIPFTLTLLGIFYSWSLLYDALLMRGDAVARRFFIRNSIFTGIFLLVMYLLSLIDVLCDIWFIGVALLLAWLGFDYRRHARDLILWSPLPRLRFYTVALSLALIISYVFGVTCMFIPLFIALLGSIIWLVAATRRGQSFR